MIDPKPPEVKLICAVTFAADINLDNVIENLEGAFGPIDSQSEIINFDHTNYYLPEMGESLKKILFGFDQLIKADNLWLAKRTTIDIEYIYMKDNKRLINLDPGYLETSKFVLASTKNFSHRIYLNQGIFGEVTLLYADGKFQKLPWTYPDYLEDAFQNFLNKARNDYKKSLHQ